MRARVKNGKWVFDDPVDLPEGTEVEIVIRASPAATYVDPKVREYVHAFITALGATAQSEQDVVDSAMAYAVRAGRKYVTPADVKGVAVDVLRERVIVPAQASVRGVRAEDFIVDVLNRTETP
jgi:MoxR-like ATPase